MGATVYSQVTHQQVCRPLGLAALVDAWSEHCVEGLGQTPKVPLHRRGVPLSVRKVFLWYRQAQPVL